MAKAITFVVSGQEQPVGALATRAGGAAALARPGFARGRVKQSVRVGAQRGAGDEIRVRAEPGKDIVALHIAGGPTLYLRPDSAYDLLSAQARPPARGAATETDADLPSDEVRVPAQLQWRGLEKVPASRSATRGGFGEVVVEGIDVLTDAAADLTADLVVKKVDDQVNEGVYLLDRASLPKLKDSGAKPGRITAPPKDEPLLVLVHGTFSNTSGTFEKLWKDHPDGVAALFDHYKDRVYGLDHRTLGASPISNALTLAQALPKGARLHLLTHSRGGLVAEVMARACAQPDLATDLAFFAAQGYEQHRKDLKSLYALVKANDIQVEQVVRVACPARGTLLASKRLDAYLSIFKWSLELAGVPVAPEIVDFISEVATRRADPEKIPGLAAQIPGSSVVEWLHAAPQPIPGELRVVAGDIQGDSVVSWLKTLLADSFYWTDNDLVVQTRSMYGGVPRDHGATFVLDQGGKVSHFNYFANDITATAIVNALVEGDTRKYQPIGARSWAGADSSGVRAAITRDSTLPAAKPAVFVLPGILGSNLKVDGKRIWLGPRLVFGLEDLKYNPRGDNVAEDGPLALYDGLCEFLAETHEVIEFGFDWRKPIEEEARRLADKVQAAVAAREKNGQPVRMIAHSMGGLLARAMQLERPEVWKRMMSRAGARLLMLGTPNAGSWAPMQVLSGDDKFGNFLVAVGAPFQDYQARAMMAAFPGFIQLQAGLQDANLGLARAETWKKLADDDLATVRKYNVWHLSDEPQLAEYRWGVPTQDVLDKAVALRTRLDEQRDKVLPSFSDKMLLVVGNADFTPDGYNAAAPQGLVYLNAQESGDGRVTLASARLPDVRTWKVDCEHGKLPEEKAAYGGYLELLQTGTTALLNTLAVSGARGAATTKAEPAAVVHAASRPARGGSSGVPPSSDRDLFAPSGREQREAARDPGTALQVTVINGDLKFVRHPLMIGHYYSLRLTGTEWVMDNMIGGTMAVRLDTPYYPKDPGQSRVFHNRQVDSDYPGRIPRPEAVIVAGLGPEGKLRTSDLAFTVRGAVIEWAQRELEKPSGAPATFEIAATLIGSGGSGISAGQSAQCIVTGVREANEFLANAQWPRVGHLYLTELYLERASEAWRALQVQASSTPSQLVVTDAVQPGSGAMLRPLDSGYRGADYDLISAISTPDARGGEAIAYTLDTKRARTEIRAQQTQGPLLRALVANASNDSNADDQIGRTLFRLLVPRELEPFFGGSSEMVIELDPGTAGVPWELLDTKLPGSADTRPWAIRSKLLRKLRLDEFRHEVNDAGTDEKVLVIGEPLCDHERYPRLPGARAEANAVFKRFTVPGALGADKVVALISPDDEQLAGPDQTAVINALMAHDWRIVHISGHGEPPAKVGPAPKTCDDPPQADGDPRGVVLSGCTFLGPREIKNMRVVPQLVFVNCCHLAARNNAQLLAANYDRARFAATVAEELIKIGVRCVIAAGWAVDDATASLFATTFYDALLRGRRFIEAVAEAREAAHAIPGNTWAAYQCYGDPDWVFRMEGSDAQLPSRPLAERFASIGSSRALENALNTLMVEAKFRGKEKDDRAAGEQRSNVQYLDEQFGPKWGGIGAVAMAFGEAWDALGDRDKAIAWYQRALGAQDGSAPLKATEQLANLMVRDAWSDVERATGESKTARARLLANARKRIGDGIEVLEKLVALQPSMERLSMLGSAHKRLVMLNDAAGEPSGKAMARMKAFYEEAERAGRAAKLANVFYPALNILGAEVAMRRGAHHKPLDPEQVDAIRQMLETQMRDDPEFWAAAGRVELMVYQAVARGALGASLRAIVAEYLDLNSRVKAKSMWGSVYDQANFVLRRAIAKSDKPETRAASQLLDLLRTFT